MSDINCDGCGICNKYYTCDGCDGCDNCLFVIPRGSVLRKCEPLILSQDTLNEKTLNEKTLDKKIEIKIDENHEQLVVNTNDAIFDCKCYESVCVCDKSIECPNECDHDDFWFKCTCKCVYCEINNSR